MQSLANRLPGPVILVVEDDPDSRALYKKVLESEDYRVVLASGGTAALEILASSELPALILLDISMPDMSGEEFMAKLRQSQTLEHLKVLFVSGWDDIAARTQKAGANGYVRKPINLNTLCSEIEAHLAE